MIKWARFRLTKTNIDRLKPNELRIGLIEYSDSLYNKYQKIATVILRQDDSYRYFRKYSSIIVGPKPSLPAPASETNPARALRFLPEGQLHK